MPTNQRRNSRLKVWCVRLGAVAVLSYFSWHAYNGNFGIQSRIAMREEAFDLEIRLLRLRQHRQALEHRVGLLKDGTLERDMIDELARHSLNLAHPDEIIIFRK